MTKLIVFDLDGTLLDTLDDLVIACNFALKQHDLPQRTKEEIRSFIGDGAVLLIQRSLPTELQQDEPLLLSVLQSYRDYYAEHRNANTKPYPGVLEMLAQLKQESSKVAVLSNKPHSDTVELTKEYFNGLIDLSFGQRDGVPKKPDPKVLLEIIESFDIPPTSCCYVGDSINDILTGENAHVKTIAVSWGFTDRKNLVTTNATIVGTIPELIKHF